MSTETVNTSSDMAVVSNDNETIRTYGNLKEFSRVSNNYLKRIKDDKGGRDKTCYAIERFLTKNKRKIEKKNSEVQSQINDVNADFASTDEKGILITDDKNGTLKFTPTKLKEKTKKIDAIVSAADEIKIKLQPYYSTDTPTDLSFEELYYMTGLVLDPKKIAELYPDFDEKF